MQHINTLIDTITISIGPGPLIALLVLASLGLTLTRATHIEGNQP